jgi:DNA replication and repair protein RecF
MLTQLTLINFRNHRHTQLNGLGKMVMLVGDNGAGKTNVMEAVSLLSPGRGLRGAELESLGLAGNVGELGMAWGVSGLLQAGTDRTELHTGVREDKRSQRLLIADDKPITQTALLQQLHIHWLTPAYDPLLTGPAADRRRFLDRLVFGIFAHHLRGVNRYEQLLRERMALLRPAPHQPPAPPAWLDAVEAKLAESAVAVAAARLELVNRLNQQLAQQPDGFLHARVQLTGAVELALQDGRSALTVEDAARQHWQRQRGDDAAHGSTSYGVHRSDFVVSAQKNIDWTPGAQCSTGEQKALLLVITLAYMRLLAADTNKPSILLLDEVVAHLDSGRRQALGEQLAHLPCQLWLTATDQDFLRGWPTADKGCWMVAQGAVTASA